LRILSVAYPLLPVGPDSAGGAEQILYLLERGLVEAGHESIVIAARGSQVCGKLIETSTFAKEITDEQLRTAEAEHRRCIEVALNSYEIQLIHFHGLDFHSYMPAHAVPKLATLHLPPAWYPASIFNAHNLQLSCVSESQAKAAPSETDLPVIANGINVEKYRAGYAARNHLLWMGRICPEKGVHIALEVAHRAGLPAIMAGPVHPFRDHQLYFSERVQPLLDDLRQYVGAVALNQKLELLAQARCLLIPSLVAETSSLVAMEAISSGTPVIAFRSGALPEVIDHGVTGFIVDSQEEMVAAVDRVDDISPVKCREVARHRFNAARMVREYLTLYETLSP
jgi:glycosyltransferase involved in cell wall biosynthesis